MRDLREPTGELVEERVLARFGTGLQTTTLTPAPAGRVRWSRTPGPDHPDGWRHPGNHPGSVLERLRPDRPGARFALPGSWSARHVAWDVRGATTLAAVVRADPDADLTRRAVRDVVHGLGGLHADLRDVPAADLPPRPPGLDRLAHWLDGRPTTRAGHAWREHLFDRLGARRRDLLRALAADLATRADRSTAAVHGWLSAGNVVVGLDEAGDPLVQVLTGPDVGRGVPELDLGCLLGELVEFSFRAGRHGLDPVGFDHLAHTVRALYPHGVDRDLLHAATVLRIVLHSSDFSRFVGWDDDLLVYPGAIADLLDAQQRP